MKHYIKQGTDAVYDIRPEDEGTTAGNARGENSVDLQTERNSADDVASGAKSALVGGVGNKASGIQSASIGGGYSVSSGSNSFTMGNSCVASGDNSQAMGTTNSATANSSRATGRQSKADKWGQSSHSGGQFAAQGDSQTSILVARNSTTDATQTELFLDGVDDRCTIASDTTWVFRIMLVARRTDADNESGGYIFEGILDNNAGTTALVGTVNKTVLAEDTAAWDATVEADDTNDALVVKVTGEASKTIQWVARIELVETTG